MRKVALTKFLLKHRRAVIMLLLSKIRVEWLLIMLIKGGDTFMLGVPNGVIIFSFIQVEGRS